MPDLFKHDKKKTAPPLASDSVAHLKKQHLRLLSNYVELPTGISYENQEDDEHILVFARRHPVTNIPWLIITALLSLLPFLLPFVLPSILEPLVLQDTEISVLYTLVLIAFYYLFVAGYALLNFVSWFYNISIVTNNEVVDVDYSSVTYKNIATTNIREIQDVEYTQSGFLATFFHFGNVMIQTAGAHPNIEFIQVPNPGKINDIIMDEKRRVVGHE